MLKNIVVLLFARVKLKSEIIMKIIVNKSQIVTKVDKVSPFIDTVKSARFSRQVVKRLSEPSMRQGIHSVEMKVGLCKLETVFIFNF